MSCSEVRRLVHPSLDGELDLVRQVEVEAHLKDCPACTRAYETQRALRSALEAPDLYLRAPAGLQQRLRKVLASGAVNPGPTRKVWRPRVEWTGWTVTVAAAAMIVLAASGVWMLGSRPSADDLLAQEVVAGHIRSLLPGHLADVPSTDQHTVKPWFAGRVDFSPPVADFSAQGFGLVGGRLDYIGGRTVAALVYRRRQHIINLFVWPSGDEVSRTARNAHGYTVMHWSRAGVAYWLASDLNLTELRQFAELVDHTTAQ